MEDLMKQKLWVPLLSLLVFATGCSSLLFELQNPEVSVRSFRLLPADGLTPKFEIGLHITNPNPITLNLESITYDASIEGRRIFTGIAQGLDDIGAYGEGDVTLIAATDLVNSIRLVADLLKGDKETMSYELNAEFDIGGFSPNIHLRKRGVFSTSGY